MLNDEERNIVRAGAAAQRLVDYPEWKEFAEGIRKLREAWLMQAISKGDTDFAKGCVAAFTSVLASPEDTIAQRKEILLREQALRQQGYDEDEDDSRSESVEGESP